MGICHCKCKEEISSSNNSGNDHRNRANNIVNVPDWYNRPLDQDRPDWYMPGNESLWWKSRSSKVVEKLVLDTLNVIGTLVEK